jgi:multidrug efflux pump subunit AcrB
MTLIKKYRGFSLLLTVVLSILGIVKAWNLPMTLYPSIDFPRVSVIVRSPDIPFAEMESRITRPVGITLRGVQGVRELNSRTMQGSAEFFLRFSWHEQMSLALPRVAQAIDRIRGDLPAGTSIQAIRMYPSDTPVLTVALSSTSDNLPQITRIAKTRLIPYISNLPGVWKTEIAGGKNPEIHVEVDPYKLSGAHRTFSDVISALSTQNRIGVIGPRTEEHRLKTVQIDNTMTRTAEINKIFLPSPSGVPLPIDLLATVRRGVRPSDETIRISANGSPAVLLLVYRAHGGNALTIQRALLDHMNEFRRLLPKGCTPAIVYDQGALVSDAIRHVIWALAIGLSGAMALVILILRRGYPILLMGSLLPAILFISAGILGLLGETLNLMVLGGIAAGVGLVIDDFIVIIEGGRHAHRMSGLLVPFVLSGLITILALVPLFGMNGLVGAFFAPLAISFVTLLGVSLLVNTFVTPAFIHQEKETPVPISTGILTGLSPAVILGAGTLAFALLLLPLTHLKTNFMARMDEGSFTLDFHAPVGSSINDMDRAVLRVEDHIRALPGVIDTTRRLGTEMGFYITEPNKGDFVIRLSENHPKSTFELIRELRPWVQKNEPELDTDYSQVMEDSLGDLIGVSAPVVVEVHGQNRKDLLGTARMIRDRLSGIPGLVDLHLSVRPMGDTLDGHVIAPLASLAGLTPEAIIAQTREDLMGITATTVLSPGGPLPVRVLYPSEYRNGLIPLSHLPISESDGSLIPLSQVVTFTNTPPATEEEDKNLSPILRIEGRLDHGNLGGVIKEIKAKVSSLTLPKSSWVTYSGAYKQEQKSFRTLGEALLGSVLLIVTILYGTFRKWTPPLVLTAGMAFSVLSGIAALTFSGRTLNISSFVGLILVVGLSAENGFLVANRFESAEGNASEKLKEALSDRFLPIVMTHLANAAALLPLALGGGAGLDMERPLAVAVLGGLVGSFFSSVFLIPSALSLFTRTVSPQEGLPDVQI